MHLRDITWRGESIDDVEILRELPPELAGILTEINGFILHDGALHVRGASLAPEWHSLRAPWREPEPFSALYPTVQPADIPFAQDQVGDQFLLRHGHVLRLSAETGDVEPVANSVDDFLTRVSEDIEGFLNVGLCHTMKPGQLLLAYPPFLFRESGAATSLRSSPASEVIRFHGDLARQIRDLPDGSQVQVKLTE